jgi:hypothetical protein
LAALRSQEKYKKYHVSVLKERSTRTKAMPERPEKQLKSKDAVPRENQKKLLTASIMH